MQDIAGLVFFRNPVCRLVFFPSRRADSKTQQAAPIKHKKKKDNNRINSIPS